MSIRPDPTSALVVLASLAVVPACPAWAAAPGGRCGAAYEQALRARADADAATHRGDHRVANRRLDSGLALLGSSYATPNMMDDTGLHLMLAQVQARKARWAQAATGKRAVLTERLGLCADRPTRRND